MHVSLVLGAGTEFFFAPQDAGVRYQFRTQQVVCTLSELLEGCNTPPGTQRQIDIFRGSSQIGERLLFSLHEKTNRGFRRHARMCRLSSFVLNRAYPRHHRLKITSTSRDAFDKLRMALGRWSKRLVRISSCVALRSMVSFVAGHPSFLRRGLHVCC